ncbi:hypothetical protein BYT27DRAFT_7258432 [Phlegmacium glaucopus]|nr:hypothetical protein BYT27DRAFT_7258432 [Phlegmacium glaucopus]
MEVPEVSGCVSEEKSVIASRYLGPETKEASGLAEADVDLGSSAVDVLVKYYCGGGGVRNISRRFIVNLVQELGEDTFPEPKQPGASTTVNNPSALLNHKKTKPLRNPSTPSNHKEPPPNEPIFNPTTAITEADQKKPVTTKERKPMHIFLRLFIVSTGLGYLGNGSAAVMPIEAMIANTTSGGGKFDMIHHQPSRLMFRHEPSMESSSRSADVEARDTITIAASSPALLSPHSAPAASSSFPPRPLSQSPSPSLLCKDSPAIELNSLHITRRHSRTSILFAISDVSPSMLAKQLKMAECPRELPPFMIEPSIIG